MKYIIYMLTIVLMLNIGCDSSTDPAGINIFSLQDDKDMGAELDKQISQNTTEYPVLNNATATEYVQNIVNRIVASPDVNYEDDFDYVVTLINRDDVINAFAVPGGSIYVYTGLLKFIENEATLAGVLAHEIAHIERRHASKRMTKQYGVTFLLNLLLGDDPSQLESVAAEMLTGLAMLKNSRDDEYEADEYSFKYLQSTDWYPGAIMYFFNKIKSNQDGGFLDELLSTHPMPEDRITAVEQLIADANLAEPTETNIFATRYAEFLKTLK